MGVWIWGMDGSPSTGSMSSRCGLQFSQERWWPWWTACHVVCVLMFNHDRQTFFTCNPSLHLLIISRINIITTIVTLFTLTIIIFARSNFDVIWLFGKWVEAKLEILLHKCRRCCNHYSQIYSLQCDISLPQWTISKMLSAAIIEPRGTVLSFRILQSLS